jgi:hypothetical protein
MMEAAKLDAGWESNEVELTTEDLLAMSPSTGSIADSGALASESKDKEARRAARHAPRARRMSVAAVALTVGAIAAAAAAVAVIVPMDREPEPGMVAAALPQDTIIEEPAPPPEAEGPPVFFTNPFDETEVFEFPPGTSPEEARAAVADLLIMRAQERRALWDTQSKRRK